MTIEIIKKLLLKQLENNKWKIEVEDDYATFKHFQAFKKEAPLAAFKRLDIILISAVDNTADVEIRFIFYADPKIVGADKRRFGKKARENNFEALRGFCEDIFKTAGIKAQEFAISMSPESRTKNNFGNGNYSLPAYEAELVYYKC